MNATEEPTVETEEIIKPVKKRNFNAEAFIKKNLPSIDRPVTRITMSNVSPSYWRVNVWGKKINSECMFGDNEIIMSKFIRIDLDKDGEMVYNDVTDAKEL